MGCLWMGCVGDSAFRIRMRCAKIGHARCLVTNRSQLTVGPGLNPTSIGREPRCPSYCLVLPGFKDRTAQDWKFNV